MADTASGIGVCGASGHLPLWFERGLVVIVAAVVSLGGFGLLMAVLGKYNPWLVFTVGGAATLLVSLLAWPRRRIGADSGTRRGVWLPAIGMCVIALGFALWNGIDDGHYVSVDRDPGVYAAAGKWIASNGSLQVPPGDPWSASGALFETRSAGMSPADVISKSPANGKLEFQFNHLAPVLFAEAENIGGDRLMFALPALLGALALCAVYAAGCRLMRRPYLVLAAVTALAASLPEMSVARDTYSETSAQLLLWSGLWLLLVGYERRRLGPALLAGAAVAGTMLSRIDALVYLIPLPMLGAVLLLATPSGEARRFVGRMYGMLALGAVPVIVLGTIDLKNRSGSYYSTLHPQVTELRLGFTASLVGALVLLAVWPRVGAVRGWATRSRSPLAAVASSIAVLGLILAWSLRPAVQHPRGVYNGTVALIQPAEGLALDPTRTYDEQTMIWLSWYVGPIGLAMAVIGIGVLLYRCIQRPEPAICLLLAVAGTGTALYLWTPQITPTQIWAMRRYVPAALPFLVLSSAYAIEVGIGLMAKLEIRRSWARLVVAVPVVALIGFPLGATLPVRNFQSQSNFIAAVNKTCDTIGADAAVVFVPGDRFRLTMPQTMRSYCGVPAAQLRQPVTPGVIKAVADEWRTQGRSLWILGSSPAVISAAVPGLSSSLIAAAKNTRQLNETLSRPPTSYRTENLQIYAAQIAP